MYALKEEALSSIWQISISRSRINFAIASWSINENQKKEKRREERKELWGVRWRESRESWGRGGVEERGEEMGGEVAKRGKMTKERWTRGRRSHIRTHVTVKVRIDGGTRFFFNYYGTASLLYFVGDSRLIVSLRKAMCPFYQLLTWPLSPLSINLLTTHPVNPT